MHSFSPSRIGLSFILGPRKFRYFRDRCQRTALTWGRPFKHVVFLLNDGEDARALVADCPRLETKNASLFKCGGLLGNTIIMLVPCSGEYSKSQVCCAPESAIAAFLEDMSTMKESQDQSWAKVKWVIVGDDDEYFHGPAIVHFLSMYDSTRPLTVTGGILTKGVTLPLPHPLPSSSSSSFILHPSSLIPSSLVPSSLVPY